MGAPERVSWIRADCDVSRRLEERVAELEGQGVRPVVGGQPYTWSFGCEGSTLRAVVATGAGGGGADPVLWLGAAVDPPRVEEIWLDVGSGQPRLLELLGDPARPDPLIVRVETTTGVIWRER